MQRPERVIIIGVSALACGIASRWMGGDYKIPWPGSNFPVFETISIFTIPLTIMAFLANFTAIGRLRDARRTLNERAAAAQGAQPTVGGAAGPVANGGVGTANGAAGSAANGAAGAAGIAAGPANGAAGSASNGPAAPTGHGTVGSAGKGVAPKRSSLPGATIVLLLAGLSALPGTAQPASVGSYSPPPGTLHPRPPVITDPVDTFPIPPVNANSLFYLQRTPNPNTVVAELNIVNGALDKDEPVKVLWIRYTEQRQRQDLSWIQRHFAYGLKEKDLGNGVFELRFVSYKNVPLYLMRSTVDNKQHVFVTINGRQAILNRVYIRIDPGGSFFKPNVKYLELKGIDTQNGKELIQRLKV